MNKMPKLAYTHCQTISWLFWADIPQMGSGGTQNSAPLPILGQSRRVSDGGYRMERATGPQDDLLR